MSTSTADNNLPASHHPGRSESRPADRELILDLNFVPDWARKPASDTSFFVRKESKNGRDRSERGAPRGRDDRQGQRDGARSQRQAPRPMPKRETRAPVKPRPPVTVRFVPDDQHLAVILKKMRASGRAYPLMEITSLFLDHPDTCRVLIQVESTDPSHKLLQCAECGAATFDEKSMQTHILQKHMDMMFDEVVVEVEPPKGNFVCVRKCTLSGELLGPPNHNGTEERIRELHATRYSDLALERYREHIKTLHDADLIEAWKEKFRKQTVYIPKSKAGQHSPSAPEAKTEPTPDAPAPEDGVAPDVDVVAETPAPPAQEPTGEASPEAEAPSTEVSATAAVTPEGFTWAEASQAFLKKHEVRMTRRSFRATLPAGVARQMEDPQLRDLLSDAWRRECRAPRSLAFALRGAFRHRNMHVFRAGKQMEFITATAPAPLAPESAIESISEVLRYLQEHPGCTRQLLVEGLRPGASTDEATARDILAPLGWMIERGHIIEFFNGTLSVPQSRAATRK